MKASHRLIPASVTRRTAVWLFLLGATWCLSFAPLGWVLLQPVGLGAALALLRKLTLRTPESRGLQQVRLAWWYGFGMFSAGVCWLYISLHDYGGVPAFVAVAAVAALAAYMALYPALALGLAVHCEQRGWGHLRLSWSFSRRGQNVVNGVLDTRTRASGSNTGSSHAAVVRHSAVGALWALSEWLRAAVFTGFPWLSAGDAWIDTPLSGFYPLVGTFGVAFLTAAVASLFADWYLSVSLQTPVGADSGAALQPRRQALALAGCVVALATTGYCLNRVDWGVQAVAQVRVHLVQPNVSQTIKFDPEHITRNFLDTVLLGRQAAELSQPGEWLLFPETALPVLWLEAPASWRNAFAGLAWEYQTPVVMGAALQDGPTEYTNSVIALLPDTPDAPDVPMLRYDKRHLVPFGEFIPTGFRWFVDMMNMPLGDFTRGQGAPQAFSLGALRVLPNVCYEDVFGHELADLVRQAPAEPHVLFNVSNLAWFGGSWALEQHGQISRVRAAELRKPMVRATNTGLSGIIDARGQWTLRLPDNVRTSASGLLTGYAGLTPYARWGLTAPALAILLVFVAGWVWARARAFAVMPARDVQ